MTREERYEMAEKFVKYYSLESLDADFFFDNPPLMEDPELTFSFIEEYGEDALREFTSSELAYKGLRWASENYFGFYWDLEDLGNDLISQQDLSEWFLGLIDHLLCPKALAKKFLSGRFWYVGDNGITVFSKKP